MRSTVALVTWNNMWKDKILKSHSQCLINNKNVIYLKNKQYSIPDACLTEGGYLSSAIASSLIYTQSKTISTYHAYLYNIVVTPKVKYDSPMTIYGQEFVVTQRMRGS